MKEELGGEEDEEAGGTLIQTRLIKRWEASRIFPRIPPCRNGASTRHKWIFLLQSYGGGMALGPSSMKVSPPLLVQHLIS